jgi:hypothetical protein
MPDNEQKPQESTKNALEDGDFAEELRAVQAVVAAEIAASAKCAKSDQRAEADLEAIKF